MSDQILNELSKLFSNLNIHDYSGILESWMEDDRDISLDNIANSPEGLLISLCNDALMFNSDNPKLQRFVKELQVYFAHKSLSPQYSGVLVVLSSYARMSKARPARKEKTPKPKSIALGFDSMEQDYMENDDLVGDKAGCRLPPPPPCKPSAGTSTSANRSRALSNTSLSGNPISAATYKKQGGGGGGGGHTLEDGALAGNNSQDNFCHDKLTNIPDIMKPHTLASTSTMPSSNFQSNDYKVATEVSMVSEEVPDRTPPKEFVPAVVKTKKEADVNLVFQRISEDTLAKELLGGCLGTARGPNVVWEPRTRTMILKHPEHLNLATVYFINSALRVGLYYASICAHLEPVQLSNACESFRSRVGTYHRVYGYRTHQRTQHPPLSGGEIYNHDGMWEGDVYIGPLCYDGGTVALAEEDMDPRNVIESPVVPVTYISSCLYKQHIYKVVKEIKDEYWLSVMMAMRDDSPTLFDVNVSLSPFVTRMRDIAYLLNRTAYISGYRLMAELVESESRSTQCDVRDRILTGWLGLYVKDWWICVTECRYHHGMYELITSDGISLVNIFKNTKARMTPLLDLNTQNLMKKALVYNLIRYRCTNETFLNFSEMRIDGNKVNQYLDGLLLYDELRNSMEESSCLRTVCEYQRHLTMKLVNQVLIASSDELISLVNKDRQLLQFVDELIDTYLLRDASLHRSLIGKSTEHTENPLHQRLSHINKDMAYILNSYLEDWYTAVQRKTPTERQYLSVSANLDHENADEFTTAWDCVSWELQTEDSILEVLLPDSRYYKDLHKFLWKLERILYILSNQVLWSNRLYIFAKMSSTPLMRSLAPITVFISRFRDSMLRFAHCIKDYAQTDVIDPSVTSFKAYLQNPGDIHDIIAQFQRFITSIHLKVFFMDEKRTYLNTVERMMRLIYEVDHIARVVDDIIRGVLEQETSDDDLHEESIRAQLKDHAKVLNSKRKEWDDMVKQILKFTHVTFNAPLALRIDFNKYYYGGVVDALNSLNDDFDSEEASRAMSVGV